MAFSRTTNKTGGKNTRKTCATGGQLRRARRAGVQAEEAPSVTTPPSPEPVAPSLEPLVLSRRALRLLRRATAAAAAAAPHDDAPDDDGAPASTSGGKIGHKLSNSASSTGTDVVAWRADGRGSMDSADGSVDSTKGPLMEGQVGGKDEVLGDAATTDGTPSTSTPGSDPSNTIASTTGTEGHEVSSIASTGDQDSATDGTPLPQAPLSTEDATTEDTHEPREGRDTLLPSEKQSTLDQQCVTVRKPLSASACSYTPQHHEHIHQQEGYSTPSPDMYGAMGQVPPCHQADGMYPEQTYEQQLAAMAQQHYQQIADWQRQHEQEFMQWQQAQHEQAMYEQAIYALQHADAIMWQEQQALRAQQAMYDHQQWQQQQEAIQWQQQEAIQWQQWNEQHAMYGHHHHEAMYGQQYNCNYNCEPYQAQWYPQAQGMDPAWQCNPHGATYGTYNYTQDGMTGYPMAPEAVSPMCAEAAPRRRRRHRGGKGSRGRRAPVAF